MPRNDVSIYHNPRCSKSRQVLELLHARGIKPEVLLYLKHPPDLAVLKALHRRLGGSVEKMVRFNESLAKEQGLEPGRQSPSELLEAIARTPVLLERPIVVAGNRARIGRPPEAVLEIL